MRSKLPAAGHTLVAKDVPDLWVSEPMRSVVIQACCYRQHLFCTHLHKGAWQQRLRGSTVLASPAV